MKRVLVAATVVLAILLGSVSLASAAQLNLLPGSLGAFTVSDRCTEAVTVSPTTVTAGSASGAQVTGLTNECAGREIQLTLFGASGDAIVTGTTTIAASDPESASVTTDTFMAADITGAAVTIGTWGVLATWSYTPATSLPAVSCVSLDDPNLECTAVVTGVTSWGYPNLTHFNFFASVSSPSAEQNVRWQVTVNFVDSQFPFVPAAATGNGDSILAQGWTCASMPVLVVVGNAQHTTDKVGGGATQTIYLQATAASNPWASLFDCQ